MTPELMNQLLIALPECAEWGRVYILDFMAETMTVNDVEESFVTRIIPNLSHSNPALVLSAAKVVIKFLDGICFKGVIWCLGHSSPVPTGAAMTTPLYR